MKPEKMSEDLMGRMRFLSEMGNSRVGRCLEHIEAMEAEATRAVSLLRVCKAALMCEWSDKVLGSAVEQALFKLMDDIDGVTGDEPTVADYVAGDLADYPAPTPPSATQSARLDAERRANERDENGPARQEAVL